MKPLAGPERVDIYGVNLKSIQHNAIGVLSSDDHTQYVHVSTGAGAPADTPTRIGKLYIETASGRRWVSTGTSSSADWRPMPSAGWTPFAIPQSLTLDFSTAQSHGLQAMEAVAQPIVLYAPMLLDSLTIRLNSAVAGAQLIWSLYQQVNNSGASAENTLTRVATTNAVETLGTVGSVDLTMAVQSAPVYLDSGIYWVVLQRINTAAFAVSLLRTVLNAFSSPNLTQSKVLSWPMGATINMTSWSKLQFGYVWALRGRVFGQTSTY